VAKLAHRLWLAEKHERWARDIDLKVICTVALIHDVGDDKYHGLVRPTEAGSSYSTETDEIKRKLEYNTIRAFLDGLDCPPQVAGPVSHIVSLVSFTCESNNPGSLKAAFKDFPALRLVQNADRLDALGPMGIARASVCGGTNTSRRNNTISTLVDLIDKRFVQYPALVKTNTGTKWTKKHWVYMVEFRDRMLAQSDCDAVLRSS
jgi:uncharacterized protein